MSARMNKNDEQILRQVQQKISNKEYEKALQLLENLYLKKQNKELNYLLFHTYVLAGEYNNAIQVADEFIDEYVANDSWLFEYVKVLLHAGKILQVFILFKKLNEYFNQDEKNEFEQILKHYPSYLNKQQQRLKKELIRKLKYLPAFDLEKQRKIIAQCNLLNPQELYLNTKELLLNNDLSNFTRMSLLDMLRKTSDQLVQVRTFLGEIIDVKLNELPSIEEAEVFRKLSKEILNSKKNNENLKLKYLSELKLQLMIIYPYLNQFTFEELKKLLVAPISQLNSNEVVFRKKLTQELNKILNFKIN